MPGDYQTFAGAFCLGCIEMVWRLGVRLLHDMSACDRVVVTTAAGAGAECNHFELSEF